MSRKKCLLIEDCLLLHKYEVTLYIKKFLRHEIVQSFLAVS
jgi:hypothetical protein